MIRRLLSWLVTGSSDQYLSRSWLANASQLANYDAWTQLQAEGMVVADVAEMARRNFWKAQAEKRQRPAGLLIFPARSVNSE